jgi:hypothetical protein
MEDLDDLQALPRVPLHAAKESSEIRRSEVFCSKIIHQRSTHQIRFRRNPLFLKLVQHTHPECLDRTADNAYPRPLSSPFPCYQCHRCFSGPPIFIPMEMLDRKVEEFGNFCSAPCANTYLDKNMRDSNLATRAADLFEYMQDVHGFRGTEIGYAPHFSQRIAYGGDLTDEQFDAIVSTPGLTTHILQKPYIPTDAVIEWQYTQKEAREVEGVSATATAATQVLEAVMQEKSPEVDHHHRWDATHLRQPPVDEIEERMASLPKLAKTVGLYELWLQRKPGGLEGPISDDDGASAPTPGTRRKKSMPSVTPAPPPPPTATSTSFASLLTSSSSSKKRKKPAGVSQNGAGAPSGGK